MPRVVAIIGSKKYSLEQFWRVDKVLEGLPSDCLVISNAAPGVGRYAISKAREMGFRTDEDAAGWKRSDGSYNAQAGFARNTRLVNRCTDVIAFHDGVSRGTMDTVKKAREMGKPVRFFNSKGEVV